jgi:hypothetical protein
MGTRGACQFPGWNCRERRKSEKGWEKGSLGKGVEGWEKGSGVFCLVCSVCQVDPHPLLPGVQPFAHEVGQKQSCGPVDRRQ